jgi:hypothetical protein
VNAAGEPLSKLMDFALVTAAIGEDHTALETVSTSERINCGGGINGH